MSFFNKQIKAGDHLITERLGYTHHGIYLGKNKVIHYSGLANGLRAGPVEVTDLSTFSQGKRTYVSHHSNRVFSHRQTVKRARSRLSEDKYNLLLNNCEHFINWCIYGKASSPQVTKAITHTISMGMVHTKFGSVGLAGIGLRAIAKRF